MHRAVPAGDEYLGPAPAHSAGPGVFTPGPLRCPSTAEPPVSEAGKLHLNLRPVRRFASASSVEELLAKAEHRLAGLDPHVELVN